MKIKILTIGLLISLGMSNCLVYHPQTVDIPLISKKKDLRVDAGISLIPSVHGTISYGLTDKLAIQGFGSTGSEDNGNPKNRYYLQAATGFYKNKGNNKVLELYGGFGYGYGDAYKDAHPGNLFGNYQLYFAQLNYGKIASDISNFEIGFGIKTGYLHSELTDKNYYNWVSETGPFASYNYECILLEPVGFIRMGGKKLKLSINLGSTLIYKFGDKDRFFPYHQINLGLGLNYRF
jgi:hypothetical protein